MICISAGYCQHCVKLWREISFFHFASLAKCVCRNVCLHVLPSQELTNICCTFRGRSQSARLYVAKTRDVPRCLLWLTRKKKPLLYVTRKRLNQLVCASRVAVDVIIVILIILWYSRSINTALDNLKQRPQVSPQSLKVYRTQIDNPNPAVTSTETLQCFHLTEQWNRGNTLSPHEHTARNGKTWSAQSEHKQSIKHWRPSVNH